MPALLPRYTKEEFARRGEDLFARKIRDRIQPGHEDAFVLIDIDSGDYEVDEDELAASDRLLARHPSAQVWMRRVGSAHARRFGGLAARR